VRTPAIAIQWTEALSGDWVQLAEKGTDFLQDAVEFDVGEGAGIGVVRVVPAQTGKGRLCAGLAVFAQTFGLFLQLGETGAYR
jgi:hypothetical protein